MEGIVNNVVNDTERLVGTVRSVGKLNHFNARAQLGRTHWRFSLVCILSGLLILSSRSARPVPVLKHHISCWIYFHYFGTRFLSIYLHVWCVRKCAYRMVCSNCGLLLKERKKRRESWARACMCKGCKREVSASVTFERCVRFFLFSLSLLAWDYLRRLNHLIAKS